MLKILASTTLLILGFSGCSTKTETIIYPPCVIISSVDMPKKRVIRVHKDDEELARAYLNELRTKLSGQLQKEEKSNELCEKWRLGK